MAVLDAFHPLTGFGGQFNPRLTEDLRLYEADYWPPNDVTATGEILLEEVDPQTPVAASPREITSWIAHSFFWDYYHRIRLRPTVLQLGNVVSTQVETIEVWNAFIVPVTLGSIDGLEEGVALEGPDSFPLEFQGLQIYNWDVSITPDGPASIDITLTWDFDDVHDVSLRITGSRVIAFSFAPNWASKIIERLTWSTDILGSGTAAEQRRHLLLSPRRQFEGSLVVEDRERGLLDNTLAGWGGLVWSVPIWPDVQLLASSVSPGATVLPCSTSGRDFRVGGLVMLRSESAFETEAAEIEEIAANSLTLKRPLLASWPAGSRVYPARTARFARQPSVIAHTDTTWTATFVFELAEPSDWPALTGLPTSRGHPVYAVRPDESGGRALSNERLLEMLDNVSGIPHVHDTAGNPFPLRAHREVLDGVAERATFRSLLYLMAGRLAALWVPTHSDDLRLTGTVGPSVTALPVENVGYARFGFGMVGRRDIRIELHDGTAFHRQITDASEVDADHEQIVINSQLGVTITPASVRRISFMALVRSNSDELVITHETDVEGGATGEIEWRATRDDLA